MALKPEKQGYPVNLLPSFLSSSGQLALAAARFPPMRPCDKEEHGTLRLFLRPALSLAGRPRPATLTGKNSELARLLSTTRTTIPI